MTCYRFYAILINKPATKWTFFHFPYSCQYHATISPYTGSDFTNVSYRITVPPNEDARKPSEFVIPQLFNITDDNINEVMQSFVLVAEIGADVPEGLTCFQTEPFEPQCNANMDPSARFGATKISIIDDDGKFDMRTYYIMLDNVYDNYGVHCSYDHWILSAKTDCIRG